MSTEKLDSRTCFITGGNSGIGKETARHMLADGYKVILLCRNREKAVLAQNELQSEFGPGSVDLIIADLASLSQIEAATNEFYTKYNSLDVLINNAGLIWGNKRATTTDGHEMTFGVNHLSHFLLTYRLLPALKAGQTARIINLSSVAHRLAMFNCNDFQLENSYYNGFRAYCNSKLYNIWFTRKAAELLHKEGITVNALHPGMVASKFGDTANSPFTAMFSLLKPFARTSAEAAKIPHYLATAPELHKASGHYFKNNRISKPSRAALNPAYAEQMWQLSQKLTSVNWS